MTKQYPLIHLNGFVYAVDKEPAKGNSIYVRPMSPAGTIIGSLVEAKRTGLKGLFGSVMVDIPTIASNNPSLGLPLLSAVEEDRDAHIDAASMAIEAFTEYRSKGDRKGVQSILKNLWEAAEAKKYSIKDVWKILHLVTTQKLDSLKDGLKVAEIIKSLNPLPIAVEVEMIPGKQITARAKDGSIYESGYTSEKLKVDRKNIVNVLNWIYE